MSQADQNISNDTGSNVRADINSNLSALYSNNSGAAAPSTTTAFMWWADTSNDALKIRNAADDGFVTVGTLSATNLGLATLASPTFTGNVGIPAGTAAAPSIRRSDDTDTGLFFSAGNTVNVSTGGTNRVGIDSNGITLRDRKAVRFRDTSNSNFVAVRAPDNAAADITLTLPDNDGNSGEVLSTDGSGNLSFVAQPSAVPTGSVHQMATTTAPSGYLKCNGDAISRTTYADLFAIIGTTWGAGDGSTTFNVPDLRGEFVRGWDDSRGVDSGRSFASSQSSRNKAHDHTGTINTSTRTLTGSFNPGTHTDINATGVFTDAGNVGTQEGSDANNGRRIDFDGSHNHSVTIPSDGGTDARPRNIALMYVIKT